MHREDELVDSVQVTHLVRSWFAANAYVELSDLLAVDGNFQTVLRVGVLPWLNCPFHTILIAIVLPKVCASDDLPGHLRASCHD